MSAGEDAAAGQLLPLVYDQLIAIARRRMSAERQEHTLQATALVHEAYLRLLGDDGANLAWASRAHFFNAAAEAMRRILIEHARSRGRAKRGGGRKRQPLDIVDLAAEDNAEDILALDAAICRLAEQDDQAARIVRLRFYAGLSVEEAAEALEISPRTVKRDWAFARAWLYEQLEPSA
jgi:RNA polymerase sigma factor (TIGR02999 family)